MTKYIACVFPGQGSQSVGMLAQLAARYPMLLDTFTEVSSHIGIDLWQLAQNGPQALMNQTINTQVLMLTADVAVFRLLTQLGLKTVSFMGGHSLGEYAALVCAKALSLAHGATLVMHRGRLMQEAVPLGAGAMAVVVGLTDEVVARICLLASEGDDGVTPANYNAIGQVVIAGTSGAVARAITQAYDNGARLAQLLPISVPCHCPLLAQAAMAYEEILAETPFDTPYLPVISNVDVSVYQTPMQMRLSLKAHLFKPVRWVQTIQLLKAKQVAIVIECGPGRILTGLCKRIDKSLLALATGDNASLDQTLSLPIF
jgi:[acyl-carrier-protein] S-malonyltransferase